MAAAAAHALCALALALSLHLTCQTPLPSHGKYITQSFLDRNSYEPHYAYPEKRFKLNEPHEAGVIKGDLVKCPEGNAVVLNVTIFDYSWADIKIFVKDMHAVVRRDWPYRGAMYGAVQKWCSTPPLQVALRTGAGADDEIVLLPTVGVATSRTCGRAAVEPPVSL